MVYSFVSFEISQHRNIEEWVTFILCSCSDNVFHITMVTVKAAVFGMSLIFLPKLNHLLMLRISINRSY